MKYYSISFPGECDQDVTEVWSEKQILSSAWYRNWVYMMVQGDKAHLIDDKTAIDDWCVVHWAIEVLKEGYEMGEIRTWTDKTEYITVLRTEISVLKTRFNPDLEGTGHFNTAISVLEGRVKEIEKDLKWPYP